MIHEVEVVDDLTEEAHQAPRESLPTSPDKMLHEELRAPAGITIPTPVLSLLTTVVRAKLWRGFREAAPASGTLKKD